jgi:hypothetical protein
VKIMAPLLTFVLAVALYGMVFLAYARLVQVDPADPSRWRRVAIVVSYELLALCCLIAADLIVTRSGWAGKNDPARLATLSAGVGTLIATAIIAARREYRRKIERPAATAPLG